MNFKNLFIKRMLYPALFLFLVSIFTYSNAQKKDGKPDIIYIMADDLGYADLSCYGRKDYQTPNLDKLASQGIKFMNAYAAAPVCTPTRVAFFTGRYPARLAVGLQDEKGEYLFDLFTDPGEKNDLKEKKVGI